MEEITTPQTATEGGDPAPETPGTDPASAGEGADGSGTDNSVSLDQIKEALGKDFKDVDGALKSIKDTYNFVGSQAEYREKIDSLATALGTDEAGVLSTLNSLAMNLNDQGAPEGVQPEDTTPAQPEGNFVTREELDENNFFAKNENLSDIRDVLAPLKERHGEDMTWDQFAQTDMAKKVIEPITGFREIEQQKSALESNPRLGAVSDTMSKARESMAAANDAARAGDRQGAVQAENSARQSAIAGVIEAYDIK